VGFVVWPGVASAGFGLKAGTDDYPSRSWYPMQSHWTPACAGVTERVMGFVVWPGVASAGFGLKTGAHVYPSRSWYPMQSHWTPACAGVTERGSRGDGEGGMESVVSPSLPSA
jgi:hypothetical protein